jgi:hypothetical protein
MWAVLELIPDEPQPFECVKVHEVETTTPSMSTLVSRVVDIFCTDKIQGGQDRTLLF